MNAEPGGRRSHGSAGIGDLGPRTDAATIGLSIRAVNRWIWISVVFLIVATFVAQFARNASGVSTLVNLFDADQKINFPTGAKILLLLASTALLGTLGMTVHDRWHRVRWVGMSAVFALLTLDETAYLHQRLSDWLHNIFATSGPLRFAWILVYLPLVAGLLVLYWPFWRKLPNPLRPQLLIAAIGFAGGSGGIEFVKSALYDDERWKLSFGLVASVSDSLELLGLALLVTALLTTMGRVASAITISFNDQP